MVFRKSLAVLFLGLIAASLASAGTPMVNGAGVPITLNGRIAVAPGAASQPSSGAFAALSSWPILNTATSSSPTDTYAQYALRFPAGAVPAGDAVVVEDSGGTPLPITVGQKTTWPDGSTRIVSVWSRHGSIPASSSVQLSIGHATQAQDTTSRRSTADVAAQNISIAFTGVKGLSNTNNDGSGSFHCNVNDMGSPIEHPLSGQVVDLYVYGGYASDDAGGFSKHMYCRFYVWMPTKSDGTADAPRIITEVRNDDFNNPAAPTTNLDLMQLHATLSVGGTPLKTYDVGVNADGTQCKPGCIGMQAASAWWTANANGMPLWVSNGAAQDAIYAQQDEVYNRSTVIGMPYDLETVNLASKTRTVDTYKPYNQNTGCGWGAETGTGAHAWIQPAPTYDTDRVFANTISYWQESNVCTLLAASYAGASWIDGTSQRIPNVLPTAYQSPPNPNFGFGAPGFVYPGGFGAANITEQFTNGGVSGIYPEDFSHYPSGLSFQTYLHSGDYHLIEVALERLGGGLFGGFSNQQNLRNITLDGKTYYGLNVNSANFRAIGWRMAAVANVWTMLPDGAPEKPYLLDVAKNQVDYMNQYYADNPAMAALGVWAVSSNYTTYQEAQYMNTYVTYGVMATDQLFGSALPESHQLALTSLKHYTDSLVTYGLGPTFVAISQGISPWGSYTSPKSWRAPADLPFVATGSSGRNTPAWSVTSGSNVLAMDGRTDAGNRNIHPSPCDKLYIIDRTNSSLALTIPPPLAVGGPYYITNVNYSNPAVITFQISATCSGGVPGAPIAFDGSIAKYASGADGNLNAIPGYRVMSNLYIRITTPNTVVTNGCSGNIEGEFAGLLILATAMGYPNAATALHLLQSDPAPLSPANCNVNTADRRWQFRPSW